MKHMRTYFTRLCITFLGLSLATVALGQASGGEGAPPAPPQPEPAPIVQVVITKTLANGVTVKKQSIPGVHETAVLVQFNWGDRYDPADGAGLSQLLIDMVAMAPLDNDESSILTPELLDKKYPLGWVARSHPEHSVLAYVVPFDHLEEQLTATVNRITHAQFTSELIDQGIERMRGDIDRRFRKEVQLTPMSWIEAKAFRHVSHPHYGISPDKLAKLSGDRLRKEWAVRSDPRSITVFLVGNLGGDESVLDEMIDQSFATIEKPSDAVSDLRVTVHAEKGQDRRRRIIVDRVPGDRENVVVAFYSPSLLSPDHPAFLAVAEDFMKSALKMPGAQARVPFQYSLLLDSRAAYLTPHVWRFPKGAGQALGYWTVKIRNRKFSNTDGRLTLRRLGWQLGAPLSGSFVEAVNAQPALLYTIAYATAVREDAGDTELWESYRNKLKMLKKDDLAAARDEYFTDKNEAIFVLTPREE